MDARGSLSRPPRSPRQFPDQRLGPPGVCGLRLLLPPSPPLNPKCFCPSFLFPCCTATPLSSSSMLTTYLLRMQPAFGSPPPGITSRISSSAAPGASTRGLSSLRMSAEDVTDDCAGGACGRAPKDAPQVLRVTGGGGGGGNRVVFDVYSDPA